MVHPKFNQTPDLPRPQHVLPHTLMGLPEISRLAIDMIFQGYLPVNDDHHMLRLSPIYHKLSKSPEEFMIQFDAINI